MEVEVSETLPSLPKWPPNVNKRPELEKYAGSSMVRRQIGLSLNFTSIIFSYLLFPSVIIAPICSFTSN